jgi:hypothetical protein
VSELGGLVGEVTGTTNKDQLQLEWEYLIGGIERSSWSTAARAAGAWAIETICNELGPRWPRAWLEPGAPPPEVGACWYSLAALGGTVDLALALHKIREMPGARTIRDAIRATSRPDAMMSPRMQLRMACLALACSMDVGVETRLPKADRPADLTISDGDTACAVEVLAVMRDAKTLDASEWFDSVSWEMRELGQRYRVDFTGDVREPLDDERTTELLEELDRRGPLAARGIGLPDARIGGVSVRMAPAAQGGGNMSFNMPEVDYARRIADKLEAKVEQTRKSGADWLLVDWMDHLWHMTAWGARPLAQKAHDLALLVQRVLATEEHILGVVMTDGAVLMRPNVPEETRELPGGAVALSRQIDRWHSRESVVIPIRPLALGAAQLWRRILDAERRWAEREMHSVGLAFPGELDSSEPEVSRE